MKQPVYYLLCSHPLARIVAPNFKKAPKGGITWGMIVMAGPVTVNIKLKIEMMRRATDQLDEAGAPWIVGGWVFKPGDPFSAQLDKDIYKAAADGFAEIERAFDPKRIAIDFEPTWTRPTGEADKYIRHTDPRAFDQIAAMQPLFDWHNNLSDVRDMVVLPGRLRWVMATGLEAGCSEDLVWAEEFTYLTTTGDWSRYDRMKAAYEATGGEWMPGFFLETLDKPFVDQLFRRRVEEAFLFPTDQKRVKLWPLNEWWKK